MILLLNLATFYTIFCFENNDYTSWKNSKRDSKRNCTNARNRHNSTFYHEEFGETSWKLSESWISKIGREEFCEQAQKGSTSIWRC